MKKLKYLVVLAAVLLAAVAVNAQGKRSAKSNKMEGTVWVYSVANPQNADEVLMKMEFEFWKDSVQMSNIVPSQMVDATVKLKYVYQNSKVTILVAQATGNQAKDFVGIVTGDKMEMEISPGMKVTFVKH